MSYGRISKCLLLWIIITKNQTLVIDEMPKLFKRMHNFGVWALKSGLVFKPSPGFGQSPAFSPPQTPEKFNTIPHKHHGKLTAQTRKKLNVTTICNYPFKMIIKILIW